MGRPSTARRAGIAVLGVGHWHAPMYIDALRQAGEEIVAISDPGPDVLLRSELDYPRYSDAAALLEREQPEFVFAHAPHSEMTALAELLVEARQPFAMEKPMGIDWRGLDAVAQKAEQAGVFTAVALVSRYFPLVRKLRELKEAGELGQPVHLYYRLLAGSPERYRQMHVPWMLDPAQAGAGPLFNFGPHVVDLFLYLADSSVERVTAAWSHGIFGQKIEDLTSMLLVGGNGTIGVTEVSYTMPADYERYFSLTTDRLHYGGRIEGGTILLRDAPDMEVPGEVSTTELYATYATDTLRRFREGQPALATIQDMVPVLRVMNAAKASCESRQTVLLQDI